MEKNQELIALIEEAKSNQAVANSLIDQYMPFIKAETRKHTYIQLDNNSDEYNIAMFAFYEAILHYDKSKGSFLSLASRMIKNRLIDYARKQIRHAANISLDSPVYNDESMTVLDTVEDEKDALHSFHKRNATKEEIEEFVSVLKGYGISLYDVSNNCPKQERTMHACMDILNYALDHIDILDVLTQTKKLPIKMLKGSKVSTKIMERHRQYLIAIMLAYTNGFEIIRGHLKMVKRREVA